MPLHLKQTFPSIIWIFTEGECDGIESRLPCKIFPTLFILLGIYNFGKKYKGCWTSNTCLIIFLLFVKFAKTGSRVLFKSLWAKIKSTGNSLSEALIFASTNPQCDNRLFTELQVQYMKIPSSNLGRTCCAQKLFPTFRTFLNTTCSLHVLQKEELLTKIYLYHFLWAKIKSTTVLSYRYPLLLKSFRLQARRNGLKASRLGHPYMVVIIYPPVGIG